MATAPQPIRDATTAQRGQIRNYLDKHFDDSVGMYLDGMSDAKIAEMVGVPRVIVERMRDTAYGPVRLDPELVALRKDMDACIADLERLTKSVDEFRAKMTALAQKMDKRAA